MSKTKRTQTQAQTTRPRTTKPGMPGITKLQVYRRSAAARAMTAILDRIIDLIDQIDDYEKSNYTGQLLRDLTEAGLRTPHPANEKPEDGHDDSLGFYDYVEEDLMGFRWVLDNMRSILEGNFDRAEETTPPATAPG